MRNAVNAVNFLSIKKISIHFIVADEYGEINVYDGTILFKLVLPSSRLNQYIINSISGYHAAAFADFLNKYTEILLVLNSFFKK